MNELQTEKEEGDDVLSPKELYDRSREEKRNRSEQENKQGNKSTKKILIILYWVGVVIGIMMLIGWGLMNSPRLPPITSQGHIEDSPKTHISTTTPIVDRVQRHMLEHVDGNGVPGIIIQYNCRDYKCSDTVIKKLVTLVKEYPNVYLAPNTYTGEIILTKEGKRKILKSYNEKAIRDFIQ